MQVGRAGEDGAGERAARDGAVLELVLERTYDAGRELVFAALTRPELLRRWSAPAGLEVVDGHTDLRPGGSWSVVMQEAGGARHEAHGTYREIEWPEWIAYTHAWRADGAPETALTLELETVRGGTRLTLTQAGFASEGSRDGHRDGWSSALDNLGTLLCSVGEP